jgi:hypothetical protein
MIGRKEIGGNMEGIIIFILGMFFAMPFVMECKKLRKENERIKKVYEDSRERQCIAKKGDECSFEKVAREFKRKYEEKEYQLKELDRMFKALLYNFNNYEVEISEDDMKAAERGNIYIEQAYLKFAKRVKLLFNENYFDTKKD